jgi:hypothetical protein
MQYALDAKDKNKGWVLRFSSRCICRCFFWGGGCNTVWTDCADNTFLFSLQVHTTLQHARTISMETKKLVLHLFYSTTVLTLLHYLFKIFIIFTSKLFFVIQVVPRIWPKLTDYLWSADHTSWTSTPAPSPFYFSSAMAPTGTGELNATNAVTCLFPNNTPTSHKHTAFPCSSDIRFWCVCHSSSWRQRTTHNSLAVLFVGLKLPTNADGSSIPRFRQKST